MTGLVAATAATTPLATRLARQIAATGPISVADYMAACLTDPIDGYYMHRNPFGPGGDFVTAPEISQIFGELIGLWCVATWEAMGSPARFTLAELGPGRGTLMADALRAARIRPAFAEAARVALLEASPALRQVQQERLAGLASPLWLDEIGQMPDGPLIVIANEFFDALPIRQFVRTADGWRERLVGLGASGGLAFGLGPDLAGSATPLGDAAVAAIVEACPAGVAIIETIAARMKAEPGAALIIDYGYEGPAIGDTLQAIYRQRFDDPLAHPGHADLTAHVDFTSLASAARDAGAATSPVLDQATFLARLGIAERADTLGRGKDETTRSGIAAAVARLTGADQMGRLFKALAFGSEGLAIPVFGTAAPA